MLRACVVTKETRFLSLHALSQVRESSHCSPYEQSVQTVNANIVAKFVLDHSQKVTFLTK